MKKPEEIKKGLVEAVAEMFWATKDGDDNAMRRACGMAHKSMADALAYIQQLEAKVTNLERVRATQATSVTTMQDALFKQQLHQSRLLEERSQLEARVPRWISVEEQPPVWPCVVYDGHNPPYTPKGCIAMLHDADGRVNWIPEISLDALMKGSMPKLHNFPITHWMPLPEPPEEVRHE